MCPDGQEAAVRGEGSAGDFAAFGGDDRCQAGLSGVGDVPDAGGAVLTGGDEGAPVRAERHAADEPGVSVQDRQRPQGAAAGDLPQACGAVPAGAGEQVAAGCERQGRDHVVVGREGEVPQVQEPVGVGEDAAVGAERGLVEPALDRAGPLRVRRGGDVPELGGSADRDECGAVRAEGE